LCIYATRSDLAIDFIQGNHHVFVSTNEIHEDWSQLLFHVKHNWYELDLMEEEFVVLDENYKSDKLAFDKHKNLICFNGKQVYLLTDSSEEIPISGVDVLLVEDFWTFFNHRELFDYNHLVFSESVAKWQLEKLGEMNYHSLSNGAFVLDL